MILDYGVLKAENSARGVYFAMHMFMVKVETALGLSLGLALAGWLGFDAVASQQTTEGAFAIRFAMSWLPIVITILGLYFIYKLPLNERRMEIIGRRLGVRTKRNALVDVL